MNTPISLYDCLNAVLIDDYIMCKKGRNIGKHHIRQIERGEPLIVKKCSLCIDADLFETILPAKDKGWLK